MNSLAAKFRKRSHLYTAIFFASISCLFFLPVMLQGKLLAPGDALVQYLPAFQNGTHLWTNQILCGFPWYADPQSQTFYPLKHIFSLLPGGWNLYIIIAFALAGFFATLYAYSLTSCWTAALVAGCIFAFNGFLLSNLRHTTMVHSAVWLPLGLWAIRSARLKQNKPALWFSLTVLATALLCFAGHPQMFCYGLALLGGSVVAETLEAEKGSRLRFAILALLALMLGIGISSVVILPVAELGTFTWRWKMTYKLFVEYALLPVNFINQIFPYAFGSFKDSIYGCNYFGAYNLQSVLGYCGLFSWLLFPLGIFAFRKKPVIVYWSIALLVFSILIFGDVGPLSQLAYQLPCYNRFRAPTRHFLEITMALSCLTAAGVAALATKQVSQKVAMRAHAIFVGFFIIAAIFAYLIAGASQERVRDTASGVFGLYPWTNPALGIPIVLFIFGSIIYVLCLKRSHIFLNALTLLFILDFATVALGSEYFVASPPASALNPPEHVAWLSSELTKTHQRLLSMRGNSGSADELPVNLSMLWGIQNASGYENLFPERIANLLNMKEGGFLVDSTWSKDEDRTLDILAVKYVLLPKNDSRCPAPVGPRWKLVKEAGDALIYENLRAFPRAWLVYEPKV
jgi:multisubunit Na+/H+ antiporter MnhG subunit